MGLGTYRGTGVASRLWGIKNGPRVEGILAPRGIMDRVRLVHQRSGFTCRRGLRDFSFDEEQPTGVVSLGVAPQNGLALGVSHYYFRANFDNGVSVSEEETCLLYTSDAADE